MNSEFLVNQLKHSGDPPRCVLEHCAQQSAFSTADRHAASLDAMPFDPAGVARIVQGLLIYEHVAEPFYGCSLPEARRAESHIRPVEKIIEVLLSLDGRPLDVARPPAKRLIGICRHFMLLAVAIFRHHGVPARGRVGFGAYFRRGMFEDHWVCEYWSAAEGRWALLDAQFDEIFIRKLAIHHDIHDVPRGQFLTASDAWCKCPQRRTPCRRVRHRVQKAARPLVCRRQPDPRPRGTQRLRGAPVGCLGRAAAFRRRAVGGSARLFRPPRLADR